MKQSSSRVSKVRYTIPDKSLYRGFEIYLNLEYLDFLGKDSYLAHFDPPLPRFLPFGPSKTLVLKRARIEIDRFYSLASG